MVDEPDGDDGEAVGLRVGVGSEPEGTSRDASVHASSDEERGSDRTAEARNVVSGCAGASPRR